MAKGVITAATHKDIEYNADHPARKGRRYSSGSTQMHASKSEPSLIFCNKQPFDDTDAVLASSYKKKVNRRPSLKSTGGSSYKTRASEAFVRINPGCTLANFFILRVLFWDMVVSGGDVVTDFLRVD